MDNIQKEMRKIRKDIREKAAQFRMTAESYRELNGITTTVIREMAKSRLQDQSTAYRPERPEEHDWRKPIYKVVHNGIYGFDFILKLSDNGHYMPYGEAKRSESGEAVSIR